MHATTEQLLDLRDQRPIDSALMQHVELCERCSCQLRQLRERKQALIDLPQLAPSPQVFAQLSERLANEPVRRNKPPLLGIAAAAVAVAAIALWMVPTQLNPPAGELASLPLESQNPPAAYAPAAPAGLVAAAATVRDELVERSAALEAVSAQLADIGAAGSSSGTEEALSALETQLALVDYNLNAAQIDQYVPDEVNRLLARRVNTLENIVSVRKAELARQGYHGFQVMNASTIEEEQTW